MKIVDKLLNDILGNRFITTPCPESIQNQKEAFIRGYQAAIDQLKNCRTLVKTPTGYNIESNVDSSVIDYLERDVVDG